MDYSLGAGILDADPFSTLGGELTLDDISDVIRGDPYPPGWQQQQMGQEAQGAAWQHGHQPQQPSTSRQGPQLTPPGSFYDQKLRDVEQIVSLLRDSPPHNDYPMQFSPPNLQTLPSPTHNNYYRGMDYPGSGVSPASHMLPQLQVSPMQQHHPQHGQLSPHGLQQHSPYSPQHYQHQPQASPPLQTNSLAYRLSAPMMQAGHVGMEMDGDLENLTVAPMSLHSPPHNVRQPPGIFVDTGNSPLIHGQQAASPPGNMLQETQQQPNYTELRTPKQEPQQQMPHRSSKLLTLLESKGNVLNLDQNVGSYLTQKMNSNAGASTSAAAEQKPRPSGIACRLKKEISITKEDEEMPPAAVQQQTGDEDEDDESDDEDEDKQTGNSSQRKGPKTERRTAHNIIEKKYRCSINDRIQQLKSMVGKEGSTAKLSKSATLRNAIEHILELRAENEHLRSVLRNNHIQIPPRPDRSMDDSQGTSPRSSNQSNVTSAQTSPVGSPRTGTKRARPMDDARVAMFAVMLAVLVWNPISLFSTGTGATVDTSFSHGRVLRSAEFESAFEQDDDSWWPPNLTRTIFIWTVNAFIVICILTRLLVYGEPVQDFKSSEWAEFLRVKARAGQCLQESLLKEAHRHLVDGLQILDRPLPSSTLDLVLSIIWQIIRHALNSLWIGRWLARRSRNAEKPQPVVCRSHAHTALVYHQLHQLHLLCPSDFPSPLCGLHLSLSAVNLAESAGASKDGLHRAHIASIYLGAALSVRLSLPRYISSIVSAYFMRRAKRHVRRSDPHTVSGLVWVFHPAARRFLSKASRVRTILSGKNTDAYPFAARTDTVNALDRLRDAFKTHLLSMLLTELKGESQKEVDVADISQLLLSLCTAVPNSAEIEKLHQEPFCCTVSAGDSVCLWWAHVLTCAIYWRSGTSTKAKTHYTMVRQCPADLLKHPLALAVGHSFCSRKLCVDDRENPKFAPLVAHHSRKSLEYLRTVVASPAMPSVNHIQEGLRILAYEWVMVSLLDGWRTSVDSTTPYWLAHPKIDYRRLYQEAFNHYQFISDQKSGNDLKCQVYRLTCRMLNGANPILTYTLLQRTRRETMNRDASGEIFRREDAPDRYHLHVLTKLHSDLNSLASRIKN